MAGPLPVVVGVVAAVVLGTGVATAVVRGGEESAAPPGVTTTVVAEAPTTTTTTSAPPTTAVPRTSTTRTTVPRVTTPTVGATTVPTTAATTTTTRPLTRAEATRALCTDIETAVRQVAGGNTLGGGLRLTRAVNTYGDVADPTVVSPARRMLSTALAGDLDASAAAALEAQAACGRLGFPITYPQQPQCITAPCPPF